MSHPKNNPFAGFDPELKQTLLGKSHVFSFFQAMRLLKILLRTETGKGIQDGRSIHIRPRLSLGFPAADIDQIREVDTGAHPGYEMIVNFLGLYGVASPLPNFYTEDLVDEDSDGESATKDFLDIVNQRLYDLFFECCTKYRQSYQVVEANNIEHLERLFCLMGIGEASFRESVDNPGKLIRYIGLLIQKPHSAMGLETILRDALGGIPVSVVPGVKRKGKIAEDQRFLLGKSDHCLGENLVVGETVADRMGKFAIRIGPLASEDHADFFPDAEKFKLARFLTDFYITERLEYDIEVILSGGEAKTVCLGNPEHARIGLNTWVFSRDSIGEMRKVYSSAA